MPREQKLPGVHYTEEDISEYIAKNTIIPFLFDATKKKCPAAFEPDGPIWQLSRDNLERYIYETVRCENYLPTETEREYATRRKHYAEVKARLAAGKIVSINDLITYNLDISRFAQDVIENCEEADLLRAFYTSIEQITILDPACGTGVFLLAALNVLEPLYEACLNRLGQTPQGDLKEPGRRQDSRAEASPAGGGKPRPYAAMFPSHDDSTSCEAEYSNRRYRIHKAIIQNNLYGVDISKEATEICKLRLLLKLVAQIECAEDIEPLPNIDSNIRAGNTLIGFATHEEATRAYLSPRQGSTRAPCLGDRYATPLRSTPAPTDTFPRKDGEPRSGDPCGGQGGGEPAFTQLDHHLAVQYGIDLNNAAAFEQWRNTHQPFHWFVEFANIMQDGGFDVIIGNPPYVEYSEVKADYRLPLDTYETSTCGNLYAYCIERSLALLTHGGRWGMIVPLSAFATGRMHSLQQLVTERSSCLHLSFLSGDANPSRLFEGVKFRLCIGLAKAGKGEFTYYSTKYVRWYAEARDTLFSSLQYCESTNSIIKGSLPKVGQDIELAILTKMTGQSPLRSFVGLGDKALYYHNCPVNWIRATTFVPGFRSDRDGTKTSSQIRRINFQSEVLRDAAVCIINSTLFFWLWLIYSDCYHLTEREIGGFPINLDQLVQRWGDVLSTISNRLMYDYKNHSRQRTYVYKTTGTVVYDEFYPKLSKPIIDEIDRVLARHYGFSDEELDFIINYDIKYRMGHKEAT